MFVCFYDLSPMLATLVLGFAMLDTLSRFVVVWLHPTPMRPCLDVTIWEASPNVELPCAYPSLFCSVRCYAYHACLCHPLVLYASLHTFLHVHTWVLLLVCRPCFNTMKLWTFNPNLHLSLTDTTFCFLSCLPSHLFACFLVFLLTMSIILICFMPLSYALCIFSFHCLSAGFLSLPLHVYT